MWSSATYWYKFLRCLKDKLGNEFTGLYTFPLYFHLPLSSTQSRQTQMFGVHKLLKESTIATPSWSNCARHGTNICTFQECVCTYYLFRLFLKRKGVCAALQYECPFFLKKKQLFRKIPLGSVIHQLLFYSLQLWYSSLAIRCLFYEAYTDDSFVFQSPFNN